MSKFNVKEERTRTITSYFDRHDITNLILEKIAKEVRLGRIGRNDPEFKIEINWKDETEGSPGYRVGVGAQVVIVQDLNRGGVEKAVGPKQEGDA